MTTIMSTMENNKHVKDVRSLRVYQEAFAVSLDVHKATLEFPAIEQPALADSMRRTSRSICASLAEGFSRQSAPTPEFKRFLQMAISASAEMRVWVEYAEALGYIAPAQSAHWRARYENISRLLQNVRINIESSGFRALELSEEA
jgi:four helix bundle protein